MATCHFCKKPLSDGEGSVCTIDGGQFNLKKMHPGDRFEEVVFSGSQAQFYICENPQCDQKVLNIVKDSIGGSAGKAGKGACYIATACYGGCDAPEVIVFREFRDRYLLRSALGRSFVDLYYKHSPYWAGKLKERRLVNHFTRKVVLDPLYLLLKKLA